MKAIRVHTYGDVDVLLYEDAPMPEPGPGEARVKIGAAGLNFIDIYQRRGWYKVSLPFTPGQEAAGVIDAIGEGVTEFKPGDLVAYAMVLGAYAEYAIVPASRLVPIPPGVSIEQAAAVMLQGMTAHYLALTTYPLKSGDVALVHAGSGGVGQLLIQIAKRLGARVIATVGAADKVALAQAAGADDVILYREQDFEAEVKRLTDGAGVHVVYDSVGKDTFLKGLNVLRPRGYMVLYGQSSGMVDPVDPQVLSQKGSLFLTRPTLGHYTLTRAELLGRAGDLFRWMATGQLHVRVDRAFGLSEAADAHRYMEARQTRGKVLLIP
ncbi:MAG: quinone oxidoreductase [Chloroflexi bacterium]|uniref:NADPH:quinone reductase n=1 Tax=Candidatus Thermofonsia Clade 3 bacterium TaxID=2364212 RepID=A0A2M8QB66_9CHLR|nr:quinone oxidoreductase [Candidatus Roseilinea sp. NK_OTU-006]PJF47046.1 MAG: NADPH:quinone reductase [Candidatus Thermofonsia Clade 3 bacterium]RMG64317.1 MAG: quinone oxidoreductase [Chloroflexota bacterium]